MLDLAGKNLVVIGGSRGVGRRIVETGLRSAARVLAVARQEDALRDLSGAFPGVETLSLDATEQAAPSRVFATLVPDVLVISGGAFPPAGALHSLSWEEFAVNFEADVKIAFHFSKAALSRPLPPGTSIVLISSGAALAGSPNSGGYAGAKRTQLFIANYAQKESDRLGLGLRFISLAPRMIPDSELGRYAVAGYARYLRISEADFVQSMESPPTSQDVAGAAIELALDSDRAKGKTFVITAKGPQVVSP
jgi:NAD(P)-dependent dehydrogenase (short-subunit alcohol dehydrogenase family)